MEGKKTAALLVSAFAVSVLLLTQATQYFFPIDTKTYDIVLEYTKCLTFQVLNSPVHILDLLPTSFLGYLSKEDESLHSPIDFELGLLRVETGGDSYDAVFLTLKCPLPKGFSSKSWMTGRLSELFDARYHRYLLAFFTNNSELGEVFRSYGLPHTYVEATYRTSDKGNENGTRFTMRYPNGSLLVDVYYTIYKNVTIHSEYSNRRWNDYHLGNDNLTILHCRQEDISRIYRRTAEGIGRLNMMTKEGTIIWKALEGSTYAVDVYLWVNYPVLRWSGEIGWIEWKYAT